MKEKLLRIDRSRILGPVKPMHGVGGGPVTANFTFDASERFRAAGIPFGRTHDIEYPFGSGEFVDIHCIFPCFEADTDDPASYNFTFTDEYLRLMREAGTEPFYRLGSSIEHQSIKRHIHPPRDYKKFADICSHIVAHYNEGWANGFHWDIRYWEVWNEPDIPQCWTGSEEQIFELYRAVSTVLKREHPDIKVGGLALTSPWSRMFEPFLKYVKEHGCPLDFVSWHGYCHTPGQAVEASNIVSSALDRYGFSGVQSIYDEWNYVVRWDDTIQASIDLHKTAFAASFMAAVISSVQSTRTDMLMFYDAQVLMSSWNNLFVPKPMTTHGAGRDVDVLKGYWALYAWNKLYKAGTQIACSSDEDIYCTAALDKNGDVLIYISFYNDDEGFDRTPPLPAKVTIDLPGMHLSELRIVDDTHDLDTAEAQGNSFVMQGNSFALARLSI